jgi:hypothetical protein
MPNKEINVLICGVSNLDISFSTDTTSCKTLVKRDVVLIVIIKVALHKNNTVAKSLGLGQCCRKSLV